jgi:hypothetical protein
MAYFIHKPRKVKYFKEGKSVYYFMDDCHIMELLNKSEYFCFMR